MLRIRPDDADARPDHRRRISPDRRRIRLDRRRGSPVETALPQPSDQQPDRRLGGAVRCPCGELRHPPLVPMLRAFPLSISLRRKRHRVPARARAHRTTVSMHGPNRRHFLAVGAAGLAAAFASSLVPPATPAVPRRRAQPRRDRPTPCSACVSWTRAGKLGAPTDVLVRGNLIAGIGTGQPADPGTGWSSRAAAGR